MKAGMHLVPETFFWNCISVLEHTERSSSLFPLFQVQIVKPPRPLKSINQVKAGTAAIERFLPREMAQTCHERRGAAAINVSQTKYAKVLESR